MGWMGVGREEEARASSRCRACAHEWALGWCPWTSPPFAPWHCAERQITNLDPDGLGDRSDDSDGDTGPRVASAEVLAKRK